MKFKKSSQQNKYSLKKNKNKKRIIVESSSDSDIMIVHNHTENDLDYSFDELKSKPISYYVKKVIVLFNVKFIFGIVFKIMYHWIYGIMNLKL